MSLWGGTLWQMCKKWADTNRAHRREDDLVRGGVEPDVLVQPASCSCMLTLCTHVSYTLPSTQDRVAEAGNVPSPVGHGAIKAEVARRAMGTLSHHVALIKNK